MKTSKNHYAARNTEMFKVLHIDDDQDFLAMFSLTFQDLFKITCCHKPDQIPWENLDQFDAVIIDFEMPGQNGMKLLKRFKAVIPELPIIMFTGQGNEEVAREAFISGASDYFTKNFNGFAYREKLANSLSRAVQIRQAQEALEKLTRETLNRYTTQNQENPSMSPVSQPGSTVDLTKSNLSLQALKTSVERYRTVVDTIPLGLSEIDTRGVYIYNNDIYLAQTGYRRDELQGRCMYEIFADEREINSTKKFIRHLLHAQPPPTPFYGKVRRRDGKIIEMKVDWNYRRGSQGEITGFISITTDVTQSRQDQQEIEKSEKKYRQLVELLREGIWALDKNEMTSFVNPSMAQMLGFTPSEMMGKSIVHFTREPWTEKLREGHKKVRRGVALEDEFVFVHKEGRQIHTKMKTTTLYDSRGNFAGAICGVTDITSRKAMELELRDRSTELEKRVRELECLFQLSEKLQVRGLSIEEILDGLAQLIPSGFREPSKTHVIIKFQGREYLSHLFKTSPHKLEEPINDQEQGRGSIQVFYSGHKNSDEIFYPQEKRLLTTIARRLERVIQRKLYQQKLQQVSLELETKVKDRTTEFMDANQQLKKEIKQRIEVELELTHTNQMFQAMVDSSPLGIIIMDNQGKVELWSRAAEKIFGWKESEVIGKPNPIVPRNDKHHFDKKLSRNLKGETFVNMERDSFRKDGSLIPTSISSSPVYDVSGNVIGAMGIIADISTQVEVRNALRHSEKKFRNLFETSPVGIAITNIEGQLLEANQAFLDMVGYTSGQISQLSIESLTPPQSYKQEREKILSTVPFLGHSDIEKQYIRSDGSLVDVWLTGWIIRDYLGNPVKLGAFAQDISRRKQAQKALEETKKRYEIATLAGRLGVWDWDITNGAMYLDPNLKKMLGYRDDEIENKMENWRKLIHPDDRAEVENLIEDCLHSDMQNYKAIHRMIHRDGHLIWIQSVGDVLRNSEGRAYRMVGTNTDITVRKIMEEELLSKNRELTDFAYRVSHDLKSPLNIIRGFVSIIEEEPKLFDEYFNKIKNSADQMADFIDRLLQLSRAGKIIETNQKVQLEILARQVFKTENHEDLPSQLEMDKPLLPVIADPIAMEQVLINLFQNSFRYHDPEKEELIISISVRRQGSNQVITFTDNGIGISRENLPKVFGTGFTGEKGKGTGFGLAIVRKIIDAHNGRIKAESPGPGKGARFVITLPGNDEPQGES